jgi:glycosyltransferase involved in cell wall biosynthesis
MKLRAKMSMDFTIITPSQNYGRFLGDCLASVAAQEGVSLEHLVIDGGSTDDSAEVAAKFPHATWIQEADEGMSDAINKGFDKATGEWVMWMNADDRLKLGSLEKMVAVPDKTNADVVYGNWDFINEKGGISRHVIAPRWSLFVHVHHHCFIGSTSAFYRRSTVIDAGYRLRKDFRHQGIDLWTSRDRSISRGTPQAWQHHRLCFTASEEGLSDIVWAIWR